MVRGNIDIVFVVDASGSMSPCIRGIVANVNGLLDQLVECGFHVRLEVVIHNVSDEHSFVLDSMHMSGPALLDGLYRGKMGRFFTEDVETFKARLSCVNAEGEKDMLMALDSALDYPFGALETTRRVVVLLSDEPFETNYNFESLARDYAERAERMILKICARHVWLFMVMPESEIAYMLSEANGSAYEIPCHSGDGLSSFDFGRFFSCLCRAISKITSRQVVQMSKERPFEKSLFGQADFDAVNKRDSCNDAGNPKKEKSGGIG